MFVIHRRHTTIRKSLNKTLTASRPVSKKPTSYCYLRIYIFWRQNVRFDLNTVLLGVRGSFTRLIHKDIHRTCGYLFRLIPRFPILHEFSTMLSTLENSEETENQLWISITRKNPPRIIPRPPVNWFEPRIYCPAPYRSCQPPSVRSSLARSSRF